MDETRHEAEQRIELDGLHAEVRMLRARAKEDAKHAERRLELEIHLATGKDVAELEERIEELKRKLVDNDAVIDRICVYIRRRGADR
jgi:hypothetical protein